MSRYGNLKKTLQRMKDLGMKPKQIELLGNYICTIMEMGIVEYRDVAADLLPETFGLIEEVAPASLPEFKDSYRLSDVHSALFPAPVPVIKPPASPARTAPLTYTPPEVEPPKDKWCKGCSRMLTEMDFSINKSTKDGLERKCRVCVANGREETRQKNIKRFAPKIMKLELPESYDRTDLWTTRRIAAMLDQRDHTITPALDALVEEKKLMRIHLKKERTDAYWRPPEVANGKV